MKLRSFKLSVSALLQTKQTILLQSNIFFNLHPEYTCVVVQPITNRRSITMWAIPHPSLLLQESENGYQHFRSGVLSCRKQFVKSKFYVHLEHTITNQKNVLIKRSLGQLITDYGMQMPLDILFSKQVCITMPCRHWLRWFIWYSF